MRTARGGMTISLVGHGAVLLWALVSFARPLETTPLRFDAGGSSSPPTNSPR